MTGRSQIYLASPLFNEWERRRNRELCDLLLPYADVFLPQEDGALLVDLLAGGTPYAEARGQVFAADMRAIQNCDIIVAVLDGRTIDEGVAFELGAAYAMGKVCWGLKTDVRVLLPSGNNPMLECALDRCFGSDSDLISALPALVPPPGVPR